MCPQHRADRKRCKDECQPSEDGFLPMSGAPPTSAGSEILPLNGPCHAFLSPFQPVEKLKCDAGGSTLVIENMKSTSREIELALRHDHHRWRFVTNHAHVLETIASERWPRSSTISSTPATSRSSARDVATATTCTKSCRCATHSTGTTPSAN